MRFLFLLITLSIVYSASCAQPTPEDQLRSYIGDECLFTNKYNAQQRRNIYPFKNAVSVMLIAFSSDDRIPVKHKTINEQKVLERVILKNNQVDSLTSILYNIGFTPIDGAIESSGGANCYEPRNGIVFFDKKGKAFEYIEICFSCHQTQTSSDRVQEGEYCSTKIDLLRDFFSYSGIKYGLGEKDHELSYQEILKLDTFDVVSAISNKIIFKADKGKNPDILNQTEKALFYAANADKIYGGNPGFSGFADFYTSNSANYYPEVISTLKKLGATLLSDALQESLKQWPEGKLPNDVSMRREWLLKNINRVDPIWQKLTDSLYNSKEDIGGVELTSKEGLRDLIYKYIFEHREDLVD